MIYSPTTSKRAGWNETRLNHISKWNNDSGIFIYLEHDLVLSNLELADAFNQEHWDKINFDPNSKLLISFSGDYVNAYDLERFDKDLTANNVDRSKVWFLAMDPLFQKFVQDRLNIPKENVGYFNYLLSNVDVPMYNTDSTKFRFSMLSRCYKEWRLDFYLRLLSKPCDILSKTIYSFHNYDPYNTAEKTISINKVLDDSDSLGFNDSKITNWIKALPYDLPNTIVQNKWSKVTYDSIQASAINICIESHYDPFIYWKELNGTNPDELSPAFATEKIYKSIACSRPFIVVSTPGFLRGLKELGFKTFNGYINEEYDNILDNDLRMQAIVEEIERLSLLSEDDFEQMIQGCREAVKHNYKLLTVMKSTSNLDDNWKWIKPYIAEQPLTTRLYNFFNMIYTKRGKQ
jgi:hypothetical protein